jgi:hypothetical protein
VIYGLSIVRFLSGKIMGEERWKRYVAPMNKHANDYHHFQHL